MWQKESVTSIYIWYEAEKSASRSHDDDKRRLPLHIAATHSDKAAIFGYECFFLKETLSFDFVLSDVSQSDSLFDSNRLSDCGIEDSISYRPWNTVCRDRGGRSHHRSNELNSCLHGGTFRARIISSSRSELWVSYHDHHSHMMLWLCKCRVVPLGLHVLPTPDNPYL